MRCDSKKFSFNQKNLLHLLTQSPLVARKEGETDADCQSVTRLFVYPALSFALLYQSAVVIKWNTKNLRRHQQMYNSLKHMSYFPFHSPVNIICMYFSSTWPCNLWSYQKRKQLSHLGLPAPLNMHLNLVLKQNKRTCDLIYYGICTLVGSEVVHDAGCTVQTAAVSSHASPERWLLTEDDASASAVRNLQA
jgi:hypothetical protein